MNAMPISIPTIKERKADIPVIIDEYCNWLSSESKPDIFFEADAKLYLASREWPGNIKQLLNTIKEYCNLSTRFPITLRSMKMLENSLNQHEKKSRNLQGLYRQGTINGQLQIFSEMTEKGAFSPPLKEVEKEYILNILKRYDQNFSQSARVLGISRKTLYDKVKKFNQAGKRAI